MGEKSIQHCNIRLCVGEIIWRIDPCIFMLREYSDEPNPSKVDEWLKIANFGTFLAFSTFWSISLGLMPWLPDRSCNHTLSEITEFIYREVLMLSCMIMVLSNQRFFNYQSS
ncbi:hypothetical protein L1887_05585 [Cichorium endivia]|nr:hypothetical protein L1887_05585 [Cichorium endivia]